MKPVNDVRQERGRDTLLVLVLLLLLLLHRINYLGVKLSLGLSIFFLAGATF